MTLVPIAVSGHTSDHRVRRTFGGTERERELGAQMAGSILVGVDYSAPSRAAIRWSVKRARLLGLSVVIAHVAQTGRGERDSAGSAHDLVRDESHYAESLDGSVAVSSIVLDGDPAIGIATAGTKSVLIVVGTHKTGFVRGRAFGSRFIGVGLRARRNVAFIPDLVSETRHQIVAGVEDTSAGLAVVRFAAAEAMRAARRLTVILAPEGMTRPGSTDRGEEFATAAIAEAKSVDESLQVRPRWSSSFFAESLVEASGSAALLVLADTRPAEAGSVNAINLVEDVLLNISSPTLVLHDG